MKMNIRPLLPSEWELFRDFRLHALQAAPGLFETTYAQAAARSEGDWRALLAPERQQIFGLFDGDKLVGMTAVFTSKDNPATAQLAMSFILPDYRGRKLSRLLYRARIDWARSRKTFRRIIVGVRASNAASTGAMRAAGFQPTHRETRSWADGVTEDEIWYELRLEP
jgi:RimJ/RimL family protein N-acetyltransferase